MLTVALNDIGGNINHDLLMSMFDKSDETVKEFFKNMNMDYLIDETKKNVSEMFNKMRVDWDSEDAYEETDMRQVLTISCTSGELEQYRTICSLLSNIDSSPLTIFNEAIRIDKLNEDDIFFIANCITLKKLLLSPQPTLDNKGKKRPYSIVLRCKTFDSARKIIASYNDTLKKDNNVINE